MLYMIVYKYAPDKRDAILRRRIANGPMVPKGMKVIGEWSDIAGGRLFKLVEVSDPMIALTAARAWNDLGKTKIVPVVETEEVMKHHSH